MSHLYKTLLVSFLLNYSWYFWKDNYNLNCKCWYIFLIQNKMDSARTNFWLPFSLSAVICLKWKKWNKDHVPHHIKMFYAFWGGLRSMKVVYTLYGQYQVWFQNFMRLEIKAVFLGTLLIWGFLLLWMNFLFKKCTFS